MEHKGKGEQGHAFVEKIKGNQVAGKIQAHQNAVYNEIKPEISFITVLMLHIPECIDSGQDPDNSDYRHKQPSHPVHFKVHRKQRCQLEQRKSSLSPAKHHDNRNCGHHKPYGCQGCHCSPFY